MTKDQKVKKGETIDGDTQQLSGSKIDYKTELSLSNEHKHTHIKD